MNNNNIQEWILAIYGRNTTTDNTNIVLYKCFGSVADAKNKLSKYINKEVETYHLKKESEITNVEGIDIL